MTTLSPSTGLPVLDEVLHGIRPRDNIIWQVESIDDYLYYGGPIIYTTVAPEEIINLLSRQKTKEQQAPNIALFSLANHYNL
jgi:hypothetical protein